MKRSNNMDMRAGSTAVTPKQKHTAEFAAEPLIPKPLVSGRDLIQLGIKPGPRFKEILEAVQTEQLEGRILAREPALEYLKRLVQEI